MQAERSDHLRVLLVYPPGSEARGLLEALGELDVTVETADHVFTAVSRFTARPADIIVLGLGETDDRDVARAIPLFRELRPGVYVLLMFPHRRRDSAVKALALGADAYLLEPPYRQEFLDLVGRAIEHARPAVPEPSGDSDEVFDRLARKLGDLIGNPLQIIELQLEQCENAADDIREEVDRIGAIAPEIQAYAERGTLHWGLVDINQLVKGVVSLRGRGRALYTRELADDLPKIRGDEEKLRYAFATLARMAEARETAGHLSVSTHRDGDAHVRIVFHAPDLILTEEEKKKLFRPFHGPICGEVGLRAATAEGIILSHEGTIEVTSLAGEAATVTIRLPVDRRSDAR